MRIATWNVNSIKQRLDALLAWLAERQPDIVCLQETKCVDDAFPREPFEALGYNLAVHGQKTFNGVALLSKLPFDEVTPGLPGDHDDDHARFIEAVVSTANGAMRVASIYLPNGNPPDTEKYSYKISWMKRLFGYARERLLLEEPLIIAGDYNVIPAAADARNPASLARRRAVPAADPRAFQSLINLGLTDAVRATSEEPGPLYVLGLPGGCVAEEQWHPHRPRLAVARSRRSANRLGIDRHVRSWEKPSDHVPVWVDLAIERPH